MDQIFLGILQRFTVDVSLNSAKAGGIVIGVIDVLLVFGFLKIFETLRARRGKRRIVIRYLLLAGSAMLIPLLWVAQTHAAFWALDAVITSLHLAILGYTVITEGRIVMAFLESLDRP